jgi:hypothetical protein
MDVRGLAGASSIAWCQADRMSDEQWFYCLKHNTVEVPTAAARPIGSGPYPDRRPRPLRLEHRPGAHRGR